MWQKTTILEELMKRLLIAAAFFAIPSVALACPDVNMGGQQLRYNGQTLYDPHSFNVVAGGSENIAKCGIRNLTQGKPEGFVAEAPDFELQFRGNGYELEFRVESNCDSVLLINTGSGNWYWDDDDNTDSALDAKIRLTNASDGLYDIWIGTIGDEVCDARLILETF